MQVKRILLTAVTFCGIVLAFAWPALWNRGPFFYYDTRTYVRSADAAIYRITGIATEWTAAEKSGVQPPHSAIQPTMRNLSGLSKKGAILGRSPYYGLLLYMGALTGGFWLTIFLQGAIGVFAVYLAVRAFGLNPWPNLLLIGLALSLFSDLPFFASFLMPDLFAGISILACALLLASPVALNRWNVGALTAMLATAMLVHDSCIAISVVLLITSGGVTGFRRSWSNWHGPACISLALGIALVGQALVSFGMRRMIHESPLRLPFLSARLVADGPGTNFLHATCPGNGFVLCQYTSEFPMRETDFLFAESAGHSVFGSADYERRKEISGQEWRFVAAVIRYDPLGVGLSVVRNFGEQLTEFGLSDFSYQSRLKIMDTNLPPDALRQIKFSRAYMGTLYERHLTGAVYVSTISCVIFLLLFFFGRWPATQARAQSKRAVSWVVMGIAINAAICGCLSGVDDRYQARVIWLLPLISFLCIACATRGQIKANYARE